MVSLCKKQAVLHVLTHTQTVPCVCVCAPMCSQTALGVHMRSDTGDVLFDVAALYPLLIQRCAWEGGSEWCLKGE